MLNRHVTSQTHYDCFNMPKTETILITQSYSSQTLQQLGTATITYKATANYSTTTPTAADNTGSTGESLKFLSEGADKTG